MAGPVAVLGGGFTARALLRAAPDRVRCVVRREAQRAELGPGDHRVLPTFTAEALGELLSGAEVVVTFPPDGTTDARLAPTLARARRVIYLSSTGVYGGARGRVDEDTPAEPSAPGAAARLEAEALYLGLGGVVLRCAGLYGPGRGLHLRLLRGQHRLPGEAANVVSRLHEDDLARIILAALERAPAGRLYTAADDAPTPQREVAAWLCLRLGLPLPPTVPEEQVDASLRADRAVANDRLKRELGLSLRFPSYREGFEDCLARLPRPT